MTDETSRPADYFTSQDATRLFVMIDTGLKRLETSFGELSNRLAVMQGQLIKQGEVINLIEADSATNRVKRLEMEIEEAERERDAAEAALRNARDKIAKKQTIKEETTDTGERLKAIAATAIVDEEKKKREEGAKRWDDLRWSAVKAVVVMMAVGFAGGLIGFIWWLVMLYMNRGGVP